MTAMQERRIAELLTGRRLHLIERLATAELAQRWRADVRRLARATHVRIRTGTADHDPRVGWALLLDPPADRP